MCTTWRRWRSSAARPTPLGSSGGEAWCARRGGPRLRNRRRRDNRRRRMLFRRTSPGRGGDARERTPERGRRREDAGRNTAWHRARADLQGVIRERRNPRQRRRMLFRRTSPGRGGDARERTPERGCRKEHREGEAPPLRRKHGKRWRKIFRPFLDNGLRRSYICTSDSPKSGSGPRKGGRAGSFLNPAYDPDQKL